MKYKAYGIVFALGLFIILMNTFPATVAPKFLSHSLSDYLWNDRFFDTLLQGFALLVTVMGVLYLEEEWPWI